MLCNRMYAFLVGLSLIVCTQTVYGMNLSTFHEPYFRYFYDTDRRVNMALFIEAGLQTRAYNCEKECVNPLKIYNTTQSSLNMLKGFGGLDTKSHLLNALDAEDDGVRSHFDLRGCIDLETSIGFVTRIGLPRNFLIGFYLPAHKLSLTNVSWTDLTQEIAEEDFRVKQGLTDDLFGVVNEFDKCLDLQGWRRAGIGDFTVMAEWQGDFVQPKPVLKNVCVNVRLGTSLPTAKREDVDKLFAFSFGNNGAMGLIFGGGLDLDLGNILHVGFDVELLHLFDNVRTRRIKTNRDQTEFLLLATNSAHKDWGLRQRFNLFAYANNFVGGLSCFFDYQFLKQGKSELTLCGNEFNSIAANTLKSLDEWTSHNIIARLVYDFGAHLDEMTRVRPSLSMYTRVPFKGKNSLQFTTLGAIVSVAF